MFIQLTASFDAGEFDSQDYTHINICSVSFNLKEECVSVTTEHGYMNEGKFVSGVAISGVTRRTYIVRDEQGEVPALDYYTFMSKTVGPTASATIFDRLMEELYQYLIDKGYYVGTIVT